MKAAAKETAIQSAICDYLTLRRVFFVRLNNIPAMFVGRDGQKQFRRLGKYARPGLADILAIKDGRPIFIEVKSEVGRLSDDQHQFGRDAIIAGGMYAVARSIDDVQRLGL